MMMNSLFDKIIQEKKENTSICRQRWKVNIFDITKSLCFRAVPIAGKKNIF